ncbi:MAG TPA: FtsK/SpoIIIE domain-containing protein [Bacillota bacterium]|nr:FtsK/SpoIIIE domain-containing protein [Bacillota bacterium]
MLHDLNKRIQQIQLLRCPNGKNKDGTVKPWTLIDWRETDYSYDLAYEVPLGYSVRDLEQETDSISASVGAYIEINNRGGAVIVSIIREDFPNSIPYSHDLLELTKERQVLLGFDRMMKPIVHDFRVPHIMIPGQSGYGKTDLTRWILYQLITRFSPDQLEINIIDMKGFSFLPFKNIPHITTIARTLPQAALVLKEAYEEMNHRSDQVWESQDRNITKNFKWKIILIDEASQISPELKKDKQEKKIASLCWQYSAAISCIGREASVGLIYATQYPTAQVIDGQIKANMDAVVCFKTENTIHSNVCLNSDLAAKLPHGKPGRAIVKANGFTEIQVPYIGDDYEWEQLLRPYTTNGRIVINDYHKEGTTQKKYTDVYIPSADSGYEFNSKVLDWSWFPNKASVRNDGRPSR